MKILFSILLFYYIPLWATLQVPDQIIIEGKTYDLLNNPLENFFEKNPQYHISNLEIYNHYKENELPIFQNTANYRGYIATFEIKNNQLYLVDLKVLSPNVEEEKYISVYQKLFGKEPMKVEYTGILVVPIDNFIDAENFGYSYLYDKYQLFTIQNDKVIRTKKLHKEEFLSFKARQFGTYKQTEAFEKEIKEMILMEKEMKKIELSPENLKGKTRKEIREQKKKYKNPLDRIMLESFLFHNKNIDFIIVDY